MKGHRRWTCALGLAAGALLTTVGCRDGSDVPAVDPIVDVFERQAQEEGLTRLETSGKRVFAHYCVTCHGDLGEGDGQKAYNLDPKPPDFHDSLPNHPPSYWRQIVDEGSSAVGRSPLCPPWKRTITAEDIDALMTYLEALIRPPVPENVSGDVRQSP